MTRDFIWVVRCAHCLASAIGDELRCQTWAATHRCPNQTTGDQPAETQPNPTGAPQ